MLTSFFFTFFELFLNGQTGLFVARIPGLAEKPDGWQAFFSVFFDFFLGHASGLGRRNDAEQLLPELVRLNLASTENERVVKIPTSAAVDLRFDGRRCQRLAFHRLR